MSDYRALRLKDLLAHQLVASKELSCRARIVRVFQRHSAPRLALDVAAAALGFASFALYACSTYYQQEYVAFEFRPAVRWTEFAISTWFLLGWAARTMAGGEVDAYFTTMNFALDVLAWAPLGILLRACTELGILTM